MAHNEEQNIRSLLRSLLDQRIPAGRISQILVVAGGCTDGTIAAVQEIAQQDSRIQVLVQPTRSGKATAINLFLKHAEEKIRIVLGADLLLPRDAVARLTEPLADPKVGMTGGRPVPLNPHVGLINRVVHLQWRLHHRLAHGDPKLGEIIAFKDAIVHLDENTCVDEACLEQLHVARGLKLVYVPQAVVFNHGPTTVRDFIEQRRRIQFGHAELEKRTGYRVSTTGLFRILVALKEELKEHPEGLPAVAPAAVCLEGWARFLGWLDLTRGRSHKVWRRIDSSKRRLYISSHASSD